MSRCKRCQERGPTGEGSPPQCAFVGGVFSKDNWNCATMNALRDVAESNAVWSEDQWVGVVPCEGSFVILTWYKRRGRTDKAWKLSLDSELSILTLKDCEEVLSHERNSI